MPESGSERRASAERPRGPLLRVIALALGAGLLSVRVAAAAGAAAAPFAAVESSARVPDAADSLARAPDTSARIAPEVPRPDTALAVHGPLDGLPIREVVIVTHNIYDPVPPGTFSTMYSLANRLHVRTQKRTVESQMLFRAGDRWTEERGRELARNLRALDFLAPVSITPHRENDSVTVEVVTRDLWTTTPEFNLESSDNKWYGSVGFSERNLAGLGKLLTANWRHDPTGSSRQFAYDDPNLAGTHGTMTLTASEGSAGGSEYAQMSVPWWALETRHAYGVQWQHTNSDLYLYEAGAQAGTMRLEMHEGDVWWGHGSYRNGNVRRFTYTFRAQDRKLGATIPESKLEPEFIGGPEELELRRFEADVRFWRPDYVERVGVNQMGVVEDFDVGRSLSLTGGYAPNFLGGHEEGYARVRLQKGADTPLGFGWIDASFESRLTTVPQQRLQRLDARWFVQPHVHYTTVLAALGVAGFQMDRDYELVIGAMNGLRAYPAQAIAGRRALRLNGEERVQFGSLFGMFIVGGVGFVDAARTWGPGAEGAQQWYSDTGVGLRLTAPGWSLGRVVRFDVAWPIDPLRDGQRKPVFSFGSSQAF